MKFFRWCLHNPVPINLIIVIFIIMGIQSSMNLKRETFPEFDVEVVEVSVSTDDSFAPELVDKNIIDLIYPSIEGIDGISKVHSHASRNMAKFFIEISNGYDADEVKDNIPGLLTYDLQASMGIVPCPPKDKIYRLTGEGENGLTMEEVKSAKIGGLLALDLIGRDGKGRLDWQMDIPVNHLVLF